MTAALTLARFLASHYRKLSHHSGAPDPVLERLYSEVEIFSKINDFEIATINLNRATFRL
jgi:hypothetical protein